MRSGHLAAIRQWAILILGVLAFALAILWLLGFGFIFGSMWFGMMNAVPAIFVAVVVVLLFVLASGAALRATPIQRINAISAGFVAACLVTGILFVFASNTNRHWVAQSHIFDAVGFGVFLGGMFFFLTIVPVALAVWCAEYKRIRSVAFYTLAGAVIGSPALFFNHGQYQNSIQDIDAWWIVAMGTLGGFIYWSTTGRNAGAWRVD